MIGLLRDQEVNNNLLSKYSLLWISSGSIQPLFPHLKLIVLCLRQITLFNIRFLKKQKDHKNYNKVANIKKLKVNAATFYYLSGYCYSCATVLQLLYSTLHAFSATAVLFNAYELLSKQYQALERLSF